MGKLFLLAFFILVVSAPVLGKMQRTTKTKPDVTIMEEMAKKRYASDYYEQKRMSQKVGAVSLLEPEPRDDCLPKGVPCSYFINPYPCCDGLCIPVATWLFGFCD